MKYRFDYLVMIVVERSIKKYLLPDAVSTTARTIARMIMAPTTTATENPTRIFFVVHQL
jgi:hypothetical protein